jgi:hypothetical protein
MRKLLLTLAVLSVIALAAAGCGSNEQTASGATELVPAGALMYGEASLKPEGDQKQAVESILAKFPGGGQASDRLKDLIEKGLRDADAPVSFKKDIEPWLGDQAAFFVVGSLIQPAGKGSAAALIATDDEDKAQAALEKSAEGKTTQHTYKDVDYLTDESGEAGAVFDGFLVLGSEPGVRAAIDTSKGGPKLSDDDGFKAKLDDAAEDRLGLFYLNSPEIAKAMPQGAGVPPALKDALKEPFIATVDADDDGVVFEGALPAQLAKTAGFLGNGSDLMADLPADSWLAFAQTDLGALIDHSVDSFAGLAGGRDTAEQQFTAATGLDLQKDVIAWMGDFGVFARGTSVADLDGALVVETKDEAASGRFIAALERLVKGQAAQAGGLEIGPLQASGGGEGFTVGGGGIPKPVHVFQKSGRVVFAYGDAAARDAVDPSQKLGDSPDFTAARDSLGDYTISFYVLMQPIFDLVEASGAATDADWQKAKPYLEPLSALVAGTSGDGDNVKSAAKLVVK